MDLRTMLSGAAGSPPSAPGSPSTGYFTEGNPGVTPPSNPGAYWFHQMSEEARAVIVAAGLTPDASTLTQLRDAILALAGQPTSFTPSLLFGGAAVGMTYTVREGYWFRQGKLVQFRFGIKLSAKGSSTGVATVALTGLPQSAYIVPLHLSVDLMSGMTHPPSALIKNATNVVELRTYDGAGSSAGQPTETNFGNTSTLYVAGCYVEV